MLKVLSWIFQKQKMILIMNLNSSLLKAFNGLQKRDE